MALTVVCRRLVRAGGAVVEDYLLVWVLASAGLGVLVPQLSVVVRASTLILAVMIGSVSLTLSVAEFRRIDRASLGVILAGHVTMPVLAYVIAHLLALSPALTAGFVVLGAVTPELVTPVMTELAGGDTALATAAVVVTGLGSVAFVPTVLSLLVGGVAVPTTPIVERVAVAVVGPMLLAVGLRSWRPARVGRYDELYPAVSALMVILVIGGATAANAGTIRTNASLLAVLGVGAIGLNGLGYGLGSLVGWRVPRTERIAVVLSVGMRDFAVATALVVAAGLPAIATLPPVLFGVVELATSAGLVRWLRSPPVPE